MSLPETPSTSASSGAGQTVRTFPARVVRPGHARRAVHAMSDSVHHSGVDLYRVRIDPEAYESAPPALYVYRQRRGEESYVGVVCDVAVEAMVDGRVRGHEAVHQQRVDALVWHHSTTDGPPALVTLLHQAGERFTAAVAEAQRTAPILDFAGQRGLHQTVWRLLDGPDTRALAAEMASADLYIADGHHRVAAATEEWRLGGRPADAGLLCVIHPMHGLSLSAFHRRVPGPVDVEQVGALLARSFEVREVDAVPALRTGSIGAYVGGRWLEVDITDEKTGQRPHGAEGLDVTILQRRVLDPLLPPGVETHPASASIDELAAQCDVDGGVLFLLAEPTPESIAEVADAGEVMPPKATYFDPKPAAGIFLRA